MKQKYDENEEESDSSSSESEDEDAEVPYSVYSVFCCHICDVITAHVEISCKYKVKQMMLSKLNLIVRDTEG